MTLLVLGIVLWVVAHTFKRFAPGVRGAMGNAGKGVVAVTILAALVLMVIGYRGADVVPVYAPVAGIGHLTVLLMLASVFMFGAGSAKGVVASKIRHPMLTGVLIWAVAHLLVNGDWASIVLFGAMGLWALLEMMLINRAEGPWDRPEPGPIAKDLRLVVVSVIILAVIAGIHIWLGHNPFLGTYA